MFLHLLFKLVRRRSVKNRNVTLLCEYFLVSYKYKTFFERHTKSIYYSSKQFPVMMDRWCKHCVKGCFKKAELIYKPLYHVVFQEICESFNLMPKGLEAKKRYCVDGTSENFEKKWDATLREIEIKCRHLLLEGHCEKLFCLMDSFWEEITGANVDLN